MEENKNIQSEIQEKQEIKTERILYDMAVNGKYDHKTDYDKGKTVLQNKIEYMPEGDRLSEAESNFVAKNYPEMLETYTSKFNWEKSSKEIVKWAGEENIKKHFSKLNLRSSSEELAKYEPELYVKLKNEINKKIPVESSLKVPSTQLFQIVEKLKERGFTSEHEALKSIEDSAKNKIPVTGIELIEKLSLVEKEEGFHPATKYNYTKGVEIITQCGLSVNEKSINNIKVNDSQNIKLPFMGKVFSEMKDHLDKLLRGEETSLVKDITIDGEKHDAKLQMFIDPATNKLKIRSSKKAKKLDVPEELSEQELQKLKNGELLPLNRGFLYNYRTTKDKTSLYLRKIIAERKKSTHKKQEVQAALKLDKELNKLVINYHIKSEDEKPVKTDVVATVVSNDDETPSVYLTDNTPKEKKDSKEHKQTLEKTKRGIGNALKVIKKDTEANQKDKLVREVLNMDHKSEKPKTTSIKVK